VNHHFLVIGLYQMPNNVRSVFVLPFTVAEPLVTVLGFALNNTFWIVDSTINAMIIWQIFEVIRLHQNRHF
jgi:hypothetical protein